MCCCDGIRSRVTDIQVDIPSLCMCVKVFLVSSQGSHDSTYKLAQLAPSSLVTIELGYLSCVPYVPCQTTNSLHDTSAIFLPQFHLFYHIRKLEDISPINTPLSHQLESYNTLKHQRNIDIFGHKMILSAQFYKGTLELESSEMHILMYSLCCYVVI